MVSCADSSDDCRALPSIGMDSPDVEAMCTVLVLTDKGSGGVILFWQWSNNVQQRAAVCCGFVNTRRSTSFP